MEKKCLKKNSEYEVFSFRISHICHIWVNYIHQGGPSTGRESQHNKPRRSLKQKMNGFVYIFTFTAPDSPFWPITDLEKSSFLSKYLELEADRETEMLREVYTWITSMIEDKIQIIPNTTIFRKWHKRGLNILTDNWSWEKLLFLSKYLGTEADIRERRQRCWEK